jgi:hypothetical protein
MGQKEKERIKRVQPRSVESLLNQVLDERGLDVPEELLLEIGEVRRFLPRRVRKGVFRGVELPGFVGLVIDVKPWKNDWAFVVYAENQGCRFAPANEMEVLRRRRK